MNFIRKKIQTLPRPSLFLMYLYALVLFIYGIFFIFGIFQGGPFALLSLLLVLSFISMPSYLLFIPINRFVSFDSMTVLALIIICIELIISIALNFFILYLAGRAIALFLPNERMRIAAIKSGVALPLVQSKSLGYVKKYLLLFFIFTAVVAIFYLILIFFFA